jgi:hypothetical protein
MNTRAVAHTDDEAPQWGPAMQALSPRRQQFVIHLFDEDAPAKGKGLLQQAARRAGLGNAQGTSTDKAISCISSRIFNDPRVQAAVREYGRTMVRSLAPAAVQAVRALIANSKHKDHARGIAMILDREWPAESTHNVKVEHYTAPTPAATEAVLKRIAELAKQAGMPKLPAPTDAVDVEYAEVPADD